MEIILIRTEPTAKLILRTKLPPSPCDHLLLNLAILSTLLLGTLIGVWVYEILRNIMGNELIPGIIATVGSLSLMGWLYSLKESLVLRGYCSVDKEKGFLYIHRWYWLFPRGISIKNIAGICKTEQTHYFREVAEDESSSSYRISDQDRFLYPSHEISSTTVTRTILILKSNRQITLDQRQGTPMNADFNESIHSLQSLVDQEVTEAGFPKLATSRHNHNHEAITTLAEFLQVPFLGYR